VSEKNQKRKEKKEVEGRSRRKKRPWIDSLIL